MQFLLVTSLVMVVAGAKTYLETVVVGILASNAVC